MDLSIKGGQWTVDTSTETNRERNFMSQIQETEIWLIYTKNEEETSRYQQVWRPLPAWALLRHGSGLDHGGDHVGLLPRLSHQHHLPVRHDLHVRHDLAGTFTFTLPQVPHCYSDVHEALPSPTCRCICKCRGRFLRIRLTITINIKFINTFLQVWPSLWK